MGLLLGGRIADSREHERVGCPPGRRLRGDAAGLHRVCLAGEALPAAGATVRGVDGTDLPCRGCGGPLDLDGWDGLCGDCADRAAAAEGL